MVLTGPDGYGISYDLRGGELPPVEDIRAWVTLARHGNDSFFGPRIAIPDEVYEFIPTVADLEYALELYGPERFARVYEVAGLWEAARAKWLVALRSDASRRESLARRGLSSGLDEFLEFPRTKPKPAPVSSPPGPAAFPLTTPPSPVPIAPPEYERPEIGVSRTMVEPPDLPEPSSIRIPVSSRETPRRAVDFRSIPEQVSLPGDNDTVAMGSGRSCGILGRGGMAVVYKIYNESLEIYRAVKLILYHRYCRDEEELGRAIRRVETEAKTWARLSHNNIVQVHDFGAWQGLPFLEMELVEGCDLKALIRRRGALPFEVVTSIGISIAKALAFAHKQRYRLQGESYAGLIHRDVKPQNILCSNTGDIKLADFGLAKPPQYVANSTTGTFIGTPQYASPEQIMSAEADGRTDIYSMGTVLYEMVTGREMFPQTSIMSVFAARQANEYKPLGKVRRTAPRDLTAVIEKCTRMSAEDRFNTAVALMECLEDCHRRITRERPEAVLEDYVLDRKLLGGTQQGPVRRKDFFGFLRGLRG